MALDVRLVVSEHQETIIVEQNIHHVLEQVWVVGTEEAGVDLVDHGAQLGIRVVVVPGIVPLGLQFAHLLLVHAEDEDVVIAHLFGHLHIGAIQCANSQSTVQLQSKNF